MACRAALGTCGLLGVLGSTLLAAAPASAATTSVDCRPDSSALVSAIGAASAGDTLLIRGRCVGPFTLDKSLTLRGAPHATLDGNAQGSTLTVIRRVTARLMALTITNGSSVVGGGMFSENPSMVVLEHVTVRGNHASSDGGGLKIGGTLRMRESSVSGKSSSNLGGGISAGGIQTGTFDKPGKVVIVASTISRNRAHGAGGGIFTDANPLTIRGSTISANTSAGEAGGIESLPLEPDSPGPGFVSGTIVAGNTSSFGGADCLIYDLGAPAAVSGGYNLAGSSCGFHAAGDQTADGPPDSFGLGPLSPNGGKTWTMPLLPRSPAVDAVPVGTTSADGRELCPAAGSTDQRGVARPQGPACDIGAFEHVK